jgi:putative ABC transport system permease protein
VARDASGGAIWRDKEMSIYVPARLSFDAAGLHLLVRTTADAAAIVPELRRIAATIDRDLRFDAVPLERLLRLWILPSRAAAAATAVLGLVALLMASVGIYGVLAYLVSQRTREIGIRMALGADGANVIGLILVDGMRLIVVGIAIGAVAAAFVSPLLGALLFGVSARDPLAFCVAAVVLAGAALLACYIPARGAARIAPIDALSGR